MPTISDMEYGFDSDGVATYLDEIKVQALEEAKNAVLDTSSLVQCCETHWEGRAREKYVENLKRDAQHCADQFDALYNILVAEVNQLNAAMANKDESLIHE